MHPYRMQVLIKQRGKDAVVNVGQRNSIYQTIEALQRAGLIEVRETRRAKRYPERTVYQATKEGRRTLRAWTSTMLSVPAREFPEFPAVLSTLDPALIPEGLASLLEQRASAIEEIRKEHEKPIPGLPRLFLLESEYSAAMARAELKWLRAIIGDLRSGRLTYPSEAEIRRLSALGGPSDEAVKRIFSEISKARKNS